MTAKAEMPTMEQETEQIPEKKTRQQKSLVNLRGKKPEEQREILNEAIEKWESEIKILRDKLNKVNEKLKDKDWDNFTSMFSPEEIQKRLAKQGK